ncbi:hypothetical protein GCM10027589_40360 [Actinocorallia lasiicapitis]
MGGYLRGITTAQPDDLRKLSDRFEDIRPKTLSEDASIELVLRTAETFGSLVGGIRG